jgi:hypothetical protein
VGGEAPGLWLKGSDITAENNVVRHPTGDDFDGIRFFGTDLTIRHNTVSDISTGPAEVEVGCIQTFNRPGVPIAPPGAPPPPPQPTTCEVHADCMQTFATGPTAPVPDTGPSRNVLIEGNRCERIASHCLIALGPHNAAGTGGGQGRTEDIRFVGNYCDAHFSAAVAFDDVRRATVRGNRIDSTEFEFGYGVFRAFSFVNNSTGGIVEDNDVAPDVAVEVAMDGSSAAGFRGPPPGGRQ